MTYEIEFTVGVEVEAESEEEACEKAWEAFEMGRCDTEITKCEPF